MLSASMNLWDIVDSSKETSPSNVDPKIKKKYSKLVKKPCLSLTSTWQTTNQCTSRVTKDPWRHGKPFVIIIRRKICPTFETLLVSYEYLITTLETLSLKELTMNYVTKMCKGNRRCFIQGWGMIPHAADRRDNLAFAVRTVSQFISKANPPYWMVVKCIMRYLKGILDFKLCLGSKDIVLRKFYDAEWA